jgi:molecular chaperone DnaK
MNTVGFDFGTTNSLVSAVTGQRVVNYFDDRGMPVPSVVCYEAGTVVVGRAAKERLRDAGLGVYGNIVRSPKTLLGQESIQIEGVERNVVDVVADLVKGIKQEIATNSRRALSSMEHAVVTIPVNFDGHRRAALRDAFRLAGIHIVQFVHEPLAALYGYFRSRKNPAESLRGFDRKYVLVFDWGGGTLDLTLCRVENGVLLQIANDGTDEVGGDVFDEVIRNEVVRVVRQKRGLPEATAIHPDAMARLLHRCERTKIDLSSRDSAQVSLNSFFQGLKDDSLEFQVSRLFLEKLVEPLVSVGLNRIVTLLAGAGVSPAQISLCLATGGMVQMPIIKARLHELFGAQRVHVPDSGASAIAEGAAWIAHDKARLRLAKKVELALARNSHLTLVDAGMSMPVENEVKRDTFQLFCVDPRDGFAKFQIVSPFRPGTHVMPNDRRAVLSTLTLAVHRDARPFFERIDLNVTIDENLVLGCRAVSSLTGEMAATHVYDLEFAVAVGENAMAGVDPLETARVAIGDDIKQSGDVTIRANGARALQKDLVPGELMYKHDPGYFDSRLNPPRMQVEERLYYEPCAKCGLNNPLCRCGSYRTSS